MSGVYVLQLNNEEYYYVGKSDNMSIRIEDHRLGGDKCAKFVSINGGVKQILDPLTPKDNNLSNWEKDETLMRMIKHGFNNVRGWEFTNTSVLTNQECDMIKMSIFGLGDRCRKCGNSGHFAKDCSSKKASWLKNLEACYSVKNKQKTSSDIINSILDDVEDEEPKKTENNSDKSVIKEVAKTGRAKCQKCKEFIPIGQFRIGKETSFKGQIAIKWYHEKCHLQDFPTKKEPITSIKYKNDDKVKIEYNTNDKLTGKIKPPNGWSSVMSKCMNCHKNGILPFIENCAKCGREKVSTQEYHKWFYMEANKNPIKVIDKQKKTRNNSCNRCGRTSHKEKDCYASVDVDGYELCDDLSEETDSEETDSEEEVWCCSYCNREFDTENGARYHEMKYCKKKYRY